MNLIFNQVNNLKAATILLVICSFTSSDAQQVDIAGVPFQSGINIVSPGVDGIHIQSAGDDGIEVRDSKYGIYIANAAERGVWVNGAAKYGGYVTNDATSTNPALYVNHGNEISGADLYLGGDGRVETDGSFAIHLDVDHNEDNSIFVVGTGLAPLLWVSENGNGGVAGNFTKAGGSFKIDHPLDPTNKYLYHSFVESPDMMNVYNGNVVLDAHGEGGVEMEDWFEALNRDYRYQLTPIGVPGPNLHIAQEIQGNTFRIAGGIPGMKVSWQVTGIRQDPFANENRIQVETIKEDFNKGKYLHPKEWGKALGLNGLESIILDEREIANNQQGAAKEIRLAEEQEAMHKKWKNQMR